jgi:hypothetical protein
MARTTALKPKPVPRTDDETRGIVLRYFYDRSRSATSARGKRGFAVKILDVRRELKASHGLSAQEVLGNLNYLMSQGWIEEEKIEKSVPLPSGTVIPQATSYYKISASGTDKIQGAGEFTMNRFHGIKIEATGQNVITLGDGNQINATFSELGKAIAELREAITKSDASEAHKMDLVADAETIQAQLAKPKPSSKIVAAAWEGMKGAATLNGLAGLVERVRVLIAPFLG